MDVADGATKVISKSNSTYNILLKTIQSDQKADSIDSEALKGQSDGLLSGKKIG